MVDIYRDAKREPIKTREKYFSIRVFCAFPFSDILAPFRVINPDFLRIYLLYFCDFLYAPEGFTSV